MVFCVSSCQSPFTGRKKEKEILLFASREAPLGWVCLKIYEDSTFEFNNACGRGKIPYFGKVKITSDTLYFSYQDSIPYAGTIALINSKYIRYINGKGNEALQIQNSKLNYSDLEGKSNKIAVSKTDLFRKYLSSLKKIPKDLVHYSMDNISKYASSYDTSTYECFKLSGCVAPVGIVQEFDSVVVVMEYSIGDYATVPFLVSYNKRGEKIDSLSLFLTSGIDMGYRGIEKLRLQLPYFEIKDTTYIWDGENDIEGSADTIIGKSVYNYDDEGFFSSAISNRTIHLRKELKIDTIGPERFVLEKSALIIQRRSRNMIYVSLEIAHQNCAIPNYEGFLIKKGNQYSGLVYEYNHNGHPLTIEIKNDRAFVTSKVDRFKWNLGIACTVEGEYKRVKYE